jgi:carbon monoxide dehydrogenase subunit G
MAQDYSAFMVFREVIEVGARAQWVHAFTSDFENLPKWDPSVISVEKKSPGAVRKGTHFHVQMRLLGMAAAMEYEVAEIERGRRTVLLGKSAAATATDTVVVEALERGSRLIWMTDIRFAGVARWLDPLLKLVFYPSVRRAMRNLRELLGRVERAPAQRSRAQRRKLAGRKRAINQ